MVKKIHRKQNLFTYFAGNLLTVVGVVLIWRAVWYALDGIDKYFFNDNHVFTVVGGVIVGLLILYLPDKDLKELEKL